MPSNVITTRSARDRLLIALRLIADRRPQNEGEEVVEDVKLPYAPRLQRWGMELSTFLPFLKVAYRRGADNGMADTGTTTLILQCTCTLDGLLQP